MLIKNNAGGMSGAELSPFFRKISECDFICTIGYDDHSQYIYDYAFDVHKQHDAPGTFFVTSGRIENQDRSFGLNEPSSWGPVTTWDNLREMHMSPTGALTVEEHTYSHPILSNLDATQLVEEWDESMRIFKKNGFNPKYVAYPYGSENSLVQQIASSYFKAGRGVGGSGISNHETGRFNTRSLIMDDTDMATVKQLIDNTKNGKRWIDLLMHAVHPDGVTDTGTVVKTPDQLSEIMQYVKDNNGIILSFDDAIAFMETFHWESNKKMFKGSI